MKKRDKGRFWSVLHRGILGCMACALVFAAGLESQAAKEGKVTTEMVNVRSEADQNSQRVGQLPAGTAFTVTEEASDGNGKVWYHIVFTSDGEQKSGWIRSDMAEITADDTQESQEGTEGTVSTGALISGISIQEPQVQPEVTEGFTQSQVTFGEISYTAWAVNLELTGGAEFYLVYGVDTAGNGGWYYYDAQLGTISQDAGQFTAAADSESEGLIEALRQENEDMQKSHEADLSMRNYIIMGVGALSLVLLIVVIILAVKLSQIEYVDDDEEYDDEEDDDSDEPSWMEIAKARKEEERRKKEHKDELDAILEEDDEEEERGAFVEAFLQEELEDELEEEQKAASKAAAKVVEAQAASMTATKSNISEDDYDDSEDFDIEIVDLDDLNL